ncbi:MAG: glycosyltransferase family 4 protein [Candidatus Moraniibacteriota bacterium]|jgi:glycosyltransferase involved in cell wall biosynthesis
MKIGIDARTILNPAKGEAIGVGHYTYQLIKHLLEIDEENEYVLFFDSRVRQKDVRKFTRKNTKIVFYPFSDYKKYMPFAYNELLGSAVLSRENLDVLHVTSTETRIPSTYRGKVIVTLHDLGIYKMPESYKKSEVIRSRIVKKFMLKKADRVIAVSESIKNDAKELFKTTADKTEVIYSGLDDRFYEDCPVNCKIVPKKFGITKKYILFLGTVEPSKNVTRLLHAFSLFKEDRMKKSRRERCDYQMLIAGKPGWLSNDIKYISKDLQLTKDVKFSGYIIGDELVPLFKNAEFFVLPSLYEGFGTTILEAFATGTPAIVTNFGSAPEISDESAILVNPVDTKEIASAMIKFADNENLRNDFKEKGLVRARDFNWNKTAKETLNVYEQCMN